MHKEFLLVAIDIDEAEAFVGVEPKALPGEESVASNEGYDGCRAAPTRDDSGRRHCKPQGAGRGKTAQQQKG
eukprot:4348594-Prymnesium_polylepis.1